MNIALSGSSAQAVPCPASIACVPVGEQAVAIQNEWLSLTIDGLMGAAATSMVHRPLNQDLAICDSYNNQKLYPFRECLHLQIMREGRIDTPPQPFTLVKTDCQADRVSVEFQGALVSPQSNGQLASYQPLLLSKSFTLLAGQPVVDLTYRLTNRGSVALPVGLWMSHGVRIPEEDVLVCAPASQGLMSAMDYWHGRPSSFLNLPQVAAPWTAALGSREPNLGFYAVWSPGQIESVYNWLGKFPGFTLGAGTPLVTLPPGAELSLPHRMGIVQGMTRIDAAWPDLVCGIDLPEPTVAQILPLTLSLASPVGGSFTASVTVRRLPDRRQQILGKVNIDLQPGVAGSASLEIRYPGEGTYLLTVQLRDSAGHTRQCRRSVTVGASLQAFHHRPPKLLGKAYWAANHLEKPLPAWTQRCDRYLKFPSVPWASPRAPRRPRVLFLGEVGWSTAVFRTLGQQGDLEWELVNLGPVGDYGTGPYGRAEIRKAVSLLNRFKPDAVLTAGVRFPDLPFHFNLDLRQRVRAGMGLIAVVKKEPHLGVWPVILREDQARVLPQPVSPLLMQLFERNIAPAPSGQVQAWSLGQGRFISVVKPLDWPEPALWGNGADRNDLLPRYRGRTELPDWEYHLAQYLQLLDLACGSERSIRFTGLSLESSAARLSCQVQTPQSALLQLELLSTDLLSRFQVERQVTLAKGTNELSLTLPDCPAGEYVAHLRMLERRDGGVLAFDAACADIVCDVRIKTIEVADPQKPVPSSITVELEGSLKSGLRVQAELRHAQDDRVVWRQTLPVAGRCVFTDISFTPLAHDGLLAVRVLDDRRILAQQSRRLHAWKPGNVADHEMAFLTAAGGEHDWYATRMVLPWALDSGFDFTLLNYGLGKAGFPWKRLKHNLLEPSITDESELRKQIHERLDQGFHQKGHAYFCLEDEFMLGDEFDWSEPTLQMFVQHMLERAGSLEALNQEWNTRFTRPQDIRPQVLEQARKNPDHPGPWLDFRLFMDRRVNRRYEVASEEAARISPLIKVGESGMYAPGLRIGQDYYLMSQAGRFFMNYAGQRCDWVRSFAHPDAVLGIWLGYGWQQPHLPWEYLFKRMQVLAWWGYLPRKPLAKMAAIGIDLTPGPNFKIIGLHQAQIRRGLGRLFQDARPTPPPVLIVHSQASIYCSELQGRSNHEASGTIAALLQHRDLSYAYVAETQIEQGQLQDNSPNLLILPAIEAMTPLAAQRCLQAHQQGCHLLADAQPAVRNGHGRRLPIGALDECWGIRARGPARCQPRNFEPIRWTTHAPTSLARLQGQLVRAVETMQAPDDRVWARYDDGTPAILGHRNSSGAWAMLLNTHLEWSHKSGIPQAVNPEDRPDELTASQTVSALFDFLVGDAGLKPALTVEPVEVAPQQSTRLELGRCLYFGLLLGSKSGSAKLTFPITAHTYDCRSGRYLGLGNSFVQSFQARQIAKVYAQLPYRVTDVDAHLESDRVCPGQTVKLQGQVKAGREMVTEHHVIHVQVVRPDGQRPRFLAWNLPAPRGRFECSFPTALNDQPGQWTVELTDTATGKKHTAAWEMQPAQANQ